MIELRPPSDGILHAIGVRLTAQLAPIGVQEVTVTYETYYDDEQGCWGRSEGLIARAHTGRHGLKVRHCTDYLERLRPIDRERGSAEWIDEFTKLLASKITTLVEIANSTVLKHTP